ncbi:MAG TPA: SDR family oxidoreductase [Anaerolineales bacterium]|jgi:NAD(P)-dependent dehydrogenase (short-subunit alcohol dehydrogenase family)|nr:SDR family oxidoreductase [Anaerolineales bacterium]
MALLDGKVAIVTGGGSGIGQAACRLYAREGARVVVSDVDEKGGNETVRAIQEENGDAFFVRADVSNPDDCQAMVAATVQQYGRLDIAFNNAGIGGEANRTADYSVEGWQKVIAINLSGVFYCMKYEIPAMLNAGGAIVNMASILGQVAFESSPAYVAAKHGVVGLTRTAAVEYAKQNLRINAVGPAFIHTPLISGLEENKQVNDLLISLHPIGRLGEAQEVAELVIWLSSEKASFVTGSYYAIDGGYLAR